MAYRWQQRADISDRMLDQELRGGDVCVGPLRCRTRSSDCQRLGRRQGRARSAMVLDRLGHWLQAGVEAAQLALQNGLSQACANLWQHAETLQRPATRR